MKYFRLVWAGLWRKKARTILTMLSIVVAFLLFGLLQGINQGFNSVVQNLDVNRLYISPKTAMDGLPLSYQARIKAVPGVQHVSHWTYFGGFFRDARNVIPAFATDVPELFAIFKEIKIEPEYIEAMQRTRTGALVSDTLAKQYGWKVGDRVPIGTSIWTNKEGSNTWYFDIVGTFDVSAYGMGFPSFYFNYGYYEESAAFGAGVVHFYLASIEDPLQGTQIAKAIDALFENSMAETRTDTESGFAQRSLEQIGDINFIVNAIVGAVLFTLLFLTANTMMQSVRERIPELAVLKTLGYSDGKVLALVLIEAFLLCIFAALIGIGLAAAIFPMLRTIMGDLPMPPIVVWMGIGVAMLLALVSGLPPAVRAQRLNIVDALAGR
jgi:putative ABC transport system permease protein